MPSAVVKAIKDFLKKNYKSQAPLLIGYSGGIDSTALLYAILECQRHWNLDIRIAHLDHGWREESSLEAEMLKKHIEQLDLPFYLKKLKLPKKENVSRISRIQFFKEVYQQLNCQALILAHQADDQSETVLKRVLEGASISALGGIPSISLLEGMVVWRPFLNLAKKQLKEWLEEKGKSWIEDSSNEDLNYLRARMRKKIFPGLTEDFGKKIQGNLVRLGLTLQELNIYLERKIQKFYSLIEERPDQIWVDFTSQIPLDPIEVKFFLKKISQENHIFLSYQALDTLYHLIIEGRYAKKVGNKNHFITVHGGCIAIKKQSVYVRVESGVFEKGPIQ